MSRIAAIVAMALLWSTQTSADEGSRNLLRNSSFEQTSLPSFPDWFHNYCGANYVGYGAVSIDATEAYHGTKSMRIKATFDRPEAGTRFYGFDAIDMEAYNPVVTPPVTQPTPFTVSAYMKADRPDVSVLLHLGQSHGGLFTLSTQWERYWYTVLVAPSELKDTVRPQEQTIPFLVRSATEFQPHTIWIDAVQIEIGETPTPYMPSHRDFVRTDVRRDEAAPATLGEPVRYACRRTTEPPVIDGDLSDPCWQTAERVGNFKLWREDKPATVQTEAAVLMDDENLYFAFWCDEPEMDRVKATKTRRDEAVHQDDCIEIFLDTNHDRRTHLQFIVNTLGTLSDVKRKESGDEFRTLENYLSWDTDWVAAVKKYDKMWTVEVKIPFASLELTPDVKSVWGMNLCRENHKIPEYSAWTFTGGSFDHATPRFGLLEGMDHAPLSKYFIEGSNLRVTLQDFFTGTYALAFDLRNRSGVDLHYIADVSLTTPTGRILNRQFKGTLKKDKSTAVSVDALPLFPEGFEEGLCSAVIRIHDAGTGGVLHVFRDERVFLHPPFHAYPERNYYTSEKTAKVILELTGVQEDQLAEINAVARIGDTDLAVGKRGLTGPTTELLLDTSTLTLGETPLTVRLFGNGRGQIAETTVRIKRLPPGPGSEVKIDHRRRMFLVHDKPFFMYFQGFHDIGGFPYLLAEAKKKHFNGVISAFSHHIFRDEDDPSANQERQRTAMEKAEELGMKVLVWLDPGWDPAWTSDRSSHADAIEAAIRDTIPRLKTSPALFGWKIMDEWWDEDITHRLYALCKELDPYHPVFINLNLGEDHFWATYGEDWWQRKDYYTDAVSWTMYPFGFEGGNRLDFMESVANGIMEMMSIKRMSPKVFWGQMLILGHRLPLVEEQRAYGYLAITSGVRGFYNFFGMPEAKELWDYAGVFGEELRQLGPVFEAQTLSKGPLQDDATLHHCLKRDTKRLYLILVNTGSASRALRFNLEEHLPSPSVRAKVWFEDRTIDVTDGILEAKIEAFGRHVYEIGLVKQGAQVQDLPFRPTN